jgi:hypothetical protein
MPTVAIPTSSGTCLVAQALKKALLSHCECSEWPCYSEIHGIAAEKDTAIVISVS